MTQAKRPLHFADHLFLYLDKKTQPMHIIGVCIFELPIGVSDDEFFAPLIHKIKTGELVPIAPLRQMLKNRLFWQTVSDFDYRQHFFVKRLDDHHNDLKALTKMVSDLHEHSLNYNIPLWEFHLVQNLAPPTPNAPRRFAILMKLHHSMTDGIALMRLIKAGLSETPDSKGVFPFWQPKDDTTPQKSKSAKNQHSTRPPIGTLLKSSLHNVGATATALFERFGTQPDGFTSPYQTPKSILNQPIDRSRQLAFVTLEKARFERLATHFNTSTNNIALAVCAGALRQYLINQNALPHKPLTTFVPISLRQDNTQTGNQLSFLPANLGTDKDNPLDRLAIINQSIDDGKNRFKNLSPAQVVAYSAVVYGAVMTNLITGIAPYHQGFNVLISNIPAIRHEQYLNGARLAHIYPASVLFNGQAMNITFSNFKETVDFGFTVCPTVLPNAELLPHLLEQSLAELEMLLEQNPTAHIS